MKTRIASCTCDQLSATVTADPVRVSICHCLACQRRSGSAFSIQARFPEDGVTVTGRASEYVLTGDEGTHARFRFCPTCGATVYYSTDELPGTIAIPVGAFAEPGFPAPRVSVYEERMHSWVGLPPDIEHMM